MAKPKRKAKAKVRPAPKFLLSTALVAGSSLKPAVQVGMGGFKAVDRVLIALNERPRIGDSLDLDAAMEAAYRNDHRWDYLFSVSDTSKLIALEPHSAKDDQISRVIDKKKAAELQLRGHLQAKYQIANWLWVSHGKTAFSRMEVATRRLAQAGITYVGRGVKSLD